MDYSDLTSKLIDSNTRAAARLITIVENDIDAAEEIINSIYQYTGKAYGVARNFGVLEREDWQTDGSWIGIIKIPAGMQTDFYDKLNDITKGNVETRILK